MVTKQNHFGQDEDQLEDEEHSTGVDLDEQEPEEAPSQIFQIVREGLERNRTVGWANAVECFRAILNNIDTPDAQEFAQAMFPDIAARCATLIRTAVQGYFEKIVDILLDQMPSKIGTFERKSVVDSLHIAVPIIVEMLRRRKMEYLNVLMTILNKKRNFYKGHKTYWQEYPGCPQVREECMKLCCDNGGLEAIFSILDGEQWIGGKASKVLLMLLVETKTVIDPELSTRICQTIMRRVLALTDEELKKEAADVMGTVVDLLERILDKSNNKDEAFAFRLTLSLKYIRSSSLPQRLFGWEQIPALVDLARRARPAAQSYRVQGAGVPEVDGVYRRCGAHDGTSKYVKVSDSGLELTLFRCTMRSNSKQWFLSDADRDKPGTDRDIDYYHQLSEENAPPQDGWVTDRQGRHPSPTCHPVKSDSDDEQEETLEHKIVEWAVKEKLLEDAFGDRMHREVVSRSVSLIRFLASMDALEVESLAKTWETAMTKGEVMKDHILSMLAEVTKDLSPELVVHLMNIVTNASKQDPGFLDAVTLTEKLAAGNIRLLLAKGPAVTDAVLNLLWALQQNPRLTNKPQELISFFNEVLCSSAATGHRDRFLEECIHELEKSASSGESHDYDERAALRAVELVPFILETYSQDGEQALAVDRLNKNFKLVDLLFRELSAYQHRMRNSPPVTTQIAPRLQLIRVVHGTSRTLELSAEQVSAIWKMLPRSEEREECLKFLSQAGVRAKNLANAFNLDVCFQAFNELICKEADFQRLGVSGFQCFRTYFLGLNKQEQHVVTVASNLSEIMEVRTLKLRGLDALWKVTVESSDMIADDAKRLLLSVYENLETTTVETHKDFLDRIFSRLSDPASEPFYSRCLQLITAFVSSSNSATLAHGASGRGKPMCVKVEGRRLRPTTTTHGGQRQQSPVCLPVIELQLHSKETLQSLREKVAKETDHPENQTRLLMRGKELRCSHATMAELGVEDRCTLTALLAATVTPKYQDRLQDAVTDPGSIIATTDKYFDILLTLMCSHLDREITNNVWAFLMAVPTNQKLLRVIADMGEEASGEFQRIDWASRLQASMYYTSIYTLQIVDAQLMPADDRDLPSAVKWRRDFVTSGGFEQALRFFMDGDFVNKPGQSVVLRIVRCCLFGANQATSPQEPIDQSSEPESPTSRMTAFADFDYLSLLQKLVFVIIQEQENDTEQSEEVLMDALCTIECILVQKDASDILLRIDGVNRVVVDTLLDNPHEEVRKVIASSLYPELANHVTDDGFIQLFGLLTNALEAIKPSSTTGRQYFDLLISLIPSGVTRMADLPMLLKKVVAKLDSIPCDSIDVLMGCLNVLSKLVLSQPAVVEHLGPPVGTFASIFFTKFLFVLPTLEDKNKWPLCRTPESRQAAFDVLGALVQRSMPDRKVIVELVRSFCQDIPETVSSDWNYEPNFTKKADCGYVGLKNQGCTCYMNAVLQQLYMVPAIRDGVMRAVVKGDAVPVTDAELVGRRIKMMYHNDKEYEAEVISFDDSRCEHSIRYENGTTATFKLSEGRNGLETGKYVVVKAPPTEAEATMAVLTESKRSFWFLSESQMRYYDPRAFVDSCKVLNMAYDVYQQNDTREFVDKLLDRWEMGMKGTPEAKFLTECFNGCQVSQKIAREPLQGEETCRKKEGKDESFIQLELEIGHPAVSHKKESVYESLAAYTEGNLMDGENQVFWEETGEKKDTLMRTVLGRLPNVLLLHLKRFDLDYNTFETIKINSRCSFPMVLYMKPFTKDGVEEREAAAEAEAMKAAEATSAGDADGDGDDVPVAMPQVRLPSSAEIAAEVAAMSEEDMDPAYVYKLCGVVIHSGYAQGGHYYSFIKDRSDGKWYKFDDDTVTEFDIANLERECFGGYQSRSQSTLEYGKWVTQDVEVESMSNALILFYEKQIRVEPVVPEDQDGNKDSQSATEDSHPDVGQSRRVNQPDAFEQTVWEANSTFVRSSYLLDSDFHSFQLKLLQCVSSSSDAEILSVTQMGTEFLFNVLLHAREKSGIKGWVRALQKLYEQNDEACRWLLMQLMTTMQARWLQDVLFECFSPQARNALVDLTAHAVQCLAPKEVSVLTSLTSVSARPADQVPQLVTEPTGGSMIISLLNTMVAMLGDAATHWKNFDQYFLLWLRVAEVHEAVRAYMCSKDYIAMLANFFLGARSPIQQYFPPVSANFNQVLGPNYGPLVQAISALVGVPVVRRAQLLEDECVVYSHDAKLSEPATIALTDIFSKFASNQHGVLGMSSNDINKYFNACGVYDNVTFFSNRIATILKEHSTTPDGRLSVQGFISFYTDAALKEEELVWKDLDKHGWRRDLRHESQVSVQSTDEAKTTPLPPLSQQILLTEEFYEAATNEKATTGSSLLHEVAQITTFICRQNLEASTHLLQGLLHRVQSAPAGWKGERLVQGCITSLASLLNLEDSLQDERLNLALDGSFGILTVTRNLSASTGETQMHDCYKMIKNLLAIKKKSAAVSTWLAKCQGEWSWMGEWLQEASLQPALGFTPAFGRHYSKIETIRALTEVHGGESVKRFPHGNNMSNGDSYSVKGAGSTIINGLYEYAGMHDGVPMYTKCGGGGTFTLYRCTLNSGVKRWYISDVVSQTPGTSADIDYYWVIRTTHVLDALTDIIRLQAGKEVWQGDPTPPRDGWNTCKTTNSSEPSAGAVDPAPVVIKSLETDASDSLADSMVEMEI